MTVSAVATGVPLAPQGALEPPAPGGATEPLRWLITGAHGQLGSDLVRLLSAAGQPVIALSSAELDITDSSAIESAVSQHRPKVIVNAAAYTAVDAAEADEDRAYLVNAVGPGLLAAAAARHRCRLVHVSTDYVFAGDATEPYQPHDETGPRSAYGRTKLAGELAVRELAPDTGYIVRTAWVYGVTGSNFAKTMARLQASHPTVSVVDDQRGSPTYAADLAAGLIELGRSAAAPGVYHCTNAGDTTWHGFTQAIFTELGADSARVLPTTTAAFPRPAPRPAYSVLSARAWIDAGLTPLRPWQDALGAAVGEGLFAEFA